MGFLGRMVGFRLNRTERHRFHGEFLLIQFEPFKSRPLLLLTGRTSDGA